MATGMAGEELLLRGTRVGADPRGNICLNSLFEIAGRPDNRRPNDWHRGARAKALERALVDRITEDSRNPSKNSDLSTYYTHGRGGAARTYAHPVLALDYAEFLDPALGVEVREVFLRFRSKDVSLAVEILEGMAEQWEYDELRVKLRQLVKDHNKLSAGAAKAAGVLNFEAYNGAGLRGLYGGRTKAQVLQHKDLPAEAHHLDHAGHEELAANYFKATQAEAKLKRDGIRGQASANQAHEEVGAAVRGTIKSLGGTMPEDEPALENIKKAEKRLKASYAVESKVLPSKPSKRVDEK